MRRKGYNLKLKQKKLIIFDLDGTLINSAFDLSLAVNYMLTQLGKETYEEEIIHEWVGNGALTLVSRALSGSRTVSDDLEEDAVQDALKLFLDYYEKNLCHKTVSYPNVVSTLKTLQNRYTLAIVTNKPYVFVEPILKGLDLDGFFDMILGGDSLSHKKPHPMPLYYVVEKLKMKIENSVMVGDSKNDIQAANACGMDSVGVTYGYNYGEDIAVHKPTIIINDFSELLEIL